MGIGKPLHGKGNMATEKIKKNIWLVSKSMWGYGKVI